MATEITTNIKRTIDVQHGPVRVDASVAQGQAQNIRLQIHRAEDQGGTIAELWIGPMETLEQVIAALSETRDALEAVVVHDIMLVSSKTTGVANDAHPNKEQP